MADQERRYSTGDRAALALLGRGRCYWPGCVQPLLKKVDGKFWIALEIAHIRAAKKGGERYVSEMTADERKSFENLIFLCVAHHKVVDAKGAESVYSIRSLMRWKADHERGLPGNLGVLDNLEEDDLAKMISSAVRERDEEIVTILSRLEEKDKIAAELLRELLDELAVLRRGEPYLDTDSIAILGGAASDLRGLEDPAAMLSVAARELEGLEDRATLLLNAAVQLDGLYDLAGTFRDAASRIGDLHADVAALKILLRNVQPLSEVVGQLREAAVHVDRATGRMEEFRGGY